MVMSVPCLSFSKRFWEIRFNNKKHLLLLPVRDLSSAYIAWTDKTINTGDAIIAANVEMVFEKALNVDNL
jgi:hypothetical protein